MILPILINLIFATYAGGSVTINEKFDEAFIRLDAGQYSKEIDFVVRKAIAADRKYLLKFLQVINKHISVYKQNNRMTLVLEYLEPELQKIDLTHYPKIQEIIRDIISHFKYNTTNYITFWNLLNNSDYWSKKDISYLISRIYRGADESYILADIIHKLTELINDFTTENIDAFEKRIRGSRLNSQLRSTLLYLLDRATLDEKIQIARNEADTYAQLTSGRKIKLGIQLRHNLKRSLINRLLSEITSDIKLKEDLLADLELTRKQQYSRKNYFKKDEYYIHYYDFLENFYKGSVLNSQQSMNMQPYCKIIFKSI